MIWIDFEHFPVHGDGVRHLTLAVIGDPFSIEARHRCGTVVGSGGRGGTFFRRLDRLLLTGSGSMIGSRYIFGLDCGLAAITGRHLGR